MVQWRCCVVFVGMAVGGCRAPWCGRPIGHSSFFDPCMPGWCDVGWLACGLFMVGSFFLQPFCWTRMCSPPHGPLVCNWFVCAAPGACTAGGCLGHCLANVATFSCSYCGFLCCYTISFDCTPPCCGCEPVVPCLHCGYLDFWLISSKHFYLENLSYTTKQQKQPEAETKQYHQSSQQ